MMIREVINKFKKYILNEKVYFKQWIKEKENIDIDFLKRQIDLFSYKPKISIIIPVYNVDVNILDNCISSVLKQLYDNWELCLVDDASPNSQIREKIVKYSETDKRIKYKIRRENGHIAKATNDGIKLSNGEFIAFMDNDDLLSPNALYEVVSALNRNEDLDIIYSDEDKINTKNKRLKPFFKPDWSPDTILSQNYVCHFLVVRKTLVEMVGGFEIGLDGAQDYDLVLKCSEKTKASKIFHISKILYHWRKVEGSTSQNPKAKEYAFDAGKKVIENALIRRGKEGNVNMGASLGTYIIEYNITGLPRVSIIIPTKEHASDLDQCLHSIITKTDYGNYEIIIIDNGSKGDELVAIYEKYSGMLKEGFKVINLDIPFNYSKLNNTAVNHATGEFLVLMNNDIEILTPNWLELMLGYAQQSHIGAVGIKLYYPDASIQHAGVVLGIGGVAGHSHKHLSKKDHGYFNRLIIPSNYSAVTAACLMVKKEDYLSVDGLDEINLPVAFNDVDFCIKLLEKGLYNICLSQVEAIHYESKSRGKENNLEKQQRFSREVEFMKKKWVDALYHDKYYNPNLSLYNEWFGINSK
ncbi:glycosyltransferase family 2 protein [Eubacterium aggregans]|uniref:glycosyltransferase family 2 protein n=1 Tax=Eubacterium aggregans TaxID=81409 RepID=UPI003F3B16DD